MEIKRLKTQYPNKFILSDEPTGLSSASAPDKYLVIMKSEGVAGLDGASAMSSTATDHSQTAFAASKSLQYELLGMPGAKSIGSGGIDITNSFETVVPGFSAQLSTLALSKVLGDERVLIVEQDGEVSNEPVAIQSKNADKFSWGLDRLDGSLDGGLDTNGWDGTGVDIYVLDTGANKEHEDYQQSLKGGYSFIGQEDEWDDCNGHGTHTAGVAVGETHGVARNANLHIVRVLKCNGGGS